MSNDRQETALEVADRHVHEGLRHISRQVEIIERLRANGLPAAEAERLLATFESLQKAHEAHLQRLRAESTMPPTNCGSRKKVTALGGQP